MRINVRKILALILSAVMLIMMVSCGTAEKETSASGTQSQEAGTTEPAETDGTPFAEESTEAITTEVPSSEAPAESSSEPADEPEKTVEKSGDIVILYTSDVHCGVDQGFGYAGLQAVREYLVSQGDDVILVDNGDSIQGEPIGTMSKGESIIDLMNQMGYDIAIPGNHEFDYGMDTFLKLAEKAEFPYISCNFNYKGELVFEPYVIRELAGKKVAFVGITTPKSLVTSQPKYFQDEDGNYVYGFMQDETGESLYQAVQAAVDAARAEGAEYVIAMGHLGDEAVAIPWTYADVISNTNGIDAFLDGHSHDSNQIIMKNKDGEDVPRSACGTKLNSIGWCRISKDDEVNVGLYSWLNGVPVPKFLGIKNEMAEAVDTAVDALADTLNKVVAKSLVELIINDPEVKDENGKPVRMVRRAETNLGNLCSDAVRNQAGADIGFSIGGSIRTNIPAGDVTLGNILNVHPFGNALSMLELTGQQILDALEWGARAVPSESGGFLQPSGLSYEIVVSIDSPCISNENGEFAGIEGERRVRNVLVDGEPIDPEKTYTVACLDYTLQDHGDGYTMFDGAKVLLDRVKLDNQVLIDYITESLNGVIGEEYEDPYGQGRIVIIE